MEGDPKTYADLCVIGRQFMQSGQTAAQFAKDNKIDLSMLRAATTHLKYQDIIKRCIENPPDESKSQSMTFVKVPQVTSSVPASVAPCAEVIESQNDIQIAIAKGVKVSISPNIDPMKIIKIIELLKDL